MVFLLAECAIIIFLFLLVFLLNYCVYSSQDEQLAPAQAEVWQRYNIYLESEQLAQWILDEERRGVKYEKSELEALVAQRLQNSLVSSDHELERTEYW
jgi:hypothetical protein